MFTCQEKKQTHSIKFWNWWRIWLDQTRESYLHWSGFSYTALPQFGADTFCPIARPLLLHFWIPKVWPKSQARLSWKQFSPVLWVGYVKNNSAVAYLPEAAISHHLLHACPCYRFVLLRHFTYHPEAQNVEVAAIITKVQGFFFEGGGGWWGAHRMYHSTLK